MPENIAHPRPTAVLDTTAKLIRVMDKAGVPFETLTGPLQSVVKRRNLMEYLNLGCPKVDGNGVIGTTPSEQDLAKLILGEDFITPEEVANARSLAYTDEQIEVLEQSLPTLEVIVWCRVNGYILLPNPPEAMPLLQVRDLKREIFYSKEGGWYADQPFARNERTEVATWIAVRKDVVPGSTGKKWNDQLPLISDIERVPNAAEACWTLTTYKEVRGVNLMSAIYARTSSVDSSGARVFVGLFDSEGLLVFSLSDGHVGDYLGMSSARKF